MPKRPTAVRGDWFLTCTNCRHCCRMRILPGDQLVGGDIDKETFLGPVHGVDENQKYVAVLVPSVPTGPPISRYLNPEPPPLVWVTVYAAVNRDGDASPVAFAQKIDPRTVQQWHDRGWTDIFLD